MTSLLCKYLDVLTATLTTYISISLFHHFIVFFRNRLAFSLEGSVGFFFTEALRVACGCDLAT